MSSLIELAADFFERMANPAFGAQANEEYALRLAAVLDGELDVRLSREATQLRSPEALTPFGWTWLLEWAKTTNTALDGDLLLDLCESFESTAFKAAVIDTATHGSSDRSISEENDRALNPWLRSLLTRVVERDPARPSTDTRDDSESFPQHHSRHARSLLMALLFVESDLTINAAASLLREQWRGDTELLEFFWDWLDAIDPESREAWLGALDPPSRPS